jgi:hypothetical protein
VHHEKYWLGEEGLVEIRYIGWETPFSIYGEKQRYEFDERVKLVDKRDAEIFYETYVDGVTIFDKVQSESS